MFGDENRDGIHVDLVVAIAWSSLFLPSSLKKREFPQILPFRRTRIQLQRQRQRQLSFHVELRVLLPRILYWVPEYSTFVPFQNVWRKGIEYIPSRVVDEDEQKANWRKRMEARSEYLNIPILGLYSKGKSIVAYLREVLNKTWLNFSRGYINSCSFFQYVLLVLSCCYIAVILLLYSCYIAVILLLYCCYIAVALMLH
jgi:hypothetical protein